MSNKRSYSNQVTESSPWPGYRCRPSCKDLERLWHFSRGMVLHHIGYIFPRYIRGRYAGPDGAAIGRNVPDRLVLQESHDELRGAAWLYLDYSDRRVEKDREPRSEGEGILRPPSTWWMRGTLFDSTNRRGSPMNVYFGMVSEKGCTSPSNPARCRVLKQNQN